jgi:flagellar motor switch protein FliN/FliY
MSDGSLSQDEIDALLQGGGSMDMSAPSSGNADLVNQFSSVLVSSTGAISSNLGSMVGKTVTIGQPMAEMVTRDGLMGSLEDELVEMKIDFSDGLTGEHSYLLSQNLATNIAGLMMGQDQVELNDAALSALEEAGNTMSGALATTLGEKVGTTVMTAVGETAKTLKASLRLPAGEFVKISYPISIEGGVSADLLEIFAMPIVQAVAGGGSAAPAASSASYPMGGGMDMFGADPMAGQGMPMSGGFGQPSVQGVQFPNLNPQPMNMDQGNIGLLMDVYMEMTVELGRTKKLIKEILGMGEGTIIELDKLAGEPVDILVNHKLIAKGEVVVIDENFGVRVTEIVSPADRLSDIG